LFTVSLAIPQLWPRKSGNTSQLMLHSSEQLTPPQSVSVEGSSRAGASLSRPLGKRILLHNSSRQKRPAANPPVLIDHREAQALFHLIRSVQQRPEWAQGLLHEATPSTSKIMSIRAIEIADLKVPPLTEDAW
jgi:hypothetical protein